MARININLRNQVHEMLFKSLSGSRRQRLNQRVKKRFSRQFEIYFGINFRHKLAKGEQIV